MKLSLGGKNIIDYLDVIIVFCLSGLIISTIIFFHITNDFGGRRDILINSLAKGQFPAPPVYYGLLYIFSFGLASGKIIFTATVFLISFFVAMKFSVTKYFVRKIMINSNPRFSNRSESEYLKSNRIVVFISSCLIIITPLSFGTSLYLGKIGINVWHNDTIIAEWPFALLLFIYSSNYLYYKEKRDFYRIIIFTIICILIKPSYFLAFIAAFPIMSLISEYIETKNLKVDNRILLILLIGLMVLFTQYYFIYKMGVSEISGSNNLQKTVIKIIPFYVWKIYSKNIPFDLAMSIMYPVVFIIGYINEVKKNIGYIYSLITFLTGLLIAILFVEAGPRDYHSNFFWTVIITNYILFAYSISLNVKFILDRRRLLIKDYFLLTVFIAHVFSGIYYISNLYILRSF